MLSCSPDGTRNWKQIEGTRTMGFNDNYWRWETRFYRICQAVFLSRPTQFNSRKVHISSRRKIFGKAENKTKQERPNYFALFAALVPSLSIFNKFPAANLWSSEISIQQNRENLNRSEDELDDRGGGHSSSTDKLLKVIHFNKSHFDSHSHQLSDKIYLNLAFPGVRRPLDRFPISLYELC